MQRRASRRSRSRPLVLGVVLAALALVGAACGGDSTDVNATADSTTSTSGPSEPVAPLTGLPDPDGEARGRPVVSVKIGNRTESRPQSGIVQADVIWEEIVEGGITRLVAMFNSEIPDVVGPVRSVRFTDPTIVWPVGGFFVYSGGVPQAVARLREAPVTDVDENAGEPIMFRDSSRESPFNLYTRPGDVLPLAPDATAPQPLFSYLEDGADLGGEPLTAVTIPFAGAEGHTARYDWDDSAGGWARTFDGEPTTDVDGNQVAPTNVVILFVDYAGGAGVEGADAQLVGSGEAWILSQGQYLRGGWSRPDLGTPAALTDFLGEPVSLTPGKTWVALPQAGTVVEVEGAPAPPA